MKRFGNLYDKICDADNLYLAYSKARKGKGKSYGVKQFESNLIENMQMIQDDLINGTYTISEYDVFTITDPKERIIYRLPFRDRVVQHTIMNILEPIWASVFISHTYSCIKGRGIHGALKHIKRDLKDSENTSYCLKMDIRKFYPSIDHEVMKLIVRKKIKDARLLNLLDDIINSAPGLPIGNYLSQFLANLYLSYFDHWLKEEKQVKYYYRYADDMVILSDDKNYLHDLQIEIGKYLNDRLKLELKDNFQVFPVTARGIDFVGYVFYHTHTRLRKRIKKKFCRRIAKLNKYKNITPKEYRIAICAWIGWTKYCNSLNLIKTVVKNEEVLRTWHKATG
ncbi:reverse transcriptase [Dysgonomonas sp. 521]|nr:reverse transcriptase/maturase family protein [Dysgonomonas sp. 521]NDV93507.1 reverse transcriptase [Dysgonomonas sp. 521]